MQVFSLLKANPDLLELIAQILGQAPRLADQLSKQPRTLEAVVGAEFAKPLYSAEQLAEEFDLVIPNSTPRDEAMDRARVLVREHQFRVGIRLLAETITAEQAGLGFSNIADQTLKKLLSPGTRGRGSKTLPLPPPEGASLRLTRAGEGWGEGLGVS